MVEATGVEPNPLGAYRLKRYEWPPKRASQRPRVGNQQPVAPCFIVPTTMFAVETDSTQTRTLHVLDSQRRR